MGLVTKVRLSDSAINLNFRLDFRYLFYSQNKLFFKSNSFSNYILSINNGKDISPKNYEDYNVSDIIYPTVNNFKGGVFNYDDVTFIDNEFNFSKFLDNDDLIITRSGTVGLTYVWDKKEVNSIFNRDVEAIPSGYLIIVKVDKNIILPTFIKLLFNSISYKKYFNVFGVGKSQKNIAQPDILSIPIPAIEIEKQKSILNKILPIESKIKNLKNAKRKPLDIINKVFGKEFGFDWEFYKEFGKGMTAGTQQSNIKEKSIYKVAFSQFQKSGIVRTSSRFHNPKTLFLNTILFSKPANKVRDIVFEKVHRGASPNYNADGEIPVVKTAHLKNGYINISEDEFVSYDTYLKSERSQIYRNDVLIASTGKVSLGRVDIVETEQELVVDGHISIIRVDNEKYNPQFLTYFLRSILGVFQIERDYTGATNQIELYSSEIENFDIPDFSLAKQSEIVEKIKTQIDAQNEIDKQIEEKQQEINKIIESAIQ